MAIISDEQMKDLCDILGLVYDEYTNAIGDSDTPESMVFELEKLIDYVNGSLPKEGIVSGCVVSIGADTTTIEMTGGTVRYNDVDLSVEAATLSAINLFRHSFDAPSQYGFVVAFSRSDLEQASTLVARTKLAAALTADTSTSIEVSDASSIAALAPPFKITIGTEEVEVWSVADGVAAIAPTYNAGTIAQNHAENAVAFISKPVVARLIFGLPVASAFQSGDNPATFSYYPSLSLKDYIVVARGLATGTRTIAVPDRTPEVVAVQDLRVLVSSPASEDTFTSDEKLQIANYANNLKTLATMSAKMESPSEVLRALVEYSTSATGQTFGDYWNDRPFVARSNYLRGESFYGITRLEFADSFKRMYKDLYGADLLTTLAIFRGDIFGGLQVYGSAPENLDAAITPSGGSLTSGTWVYRVTAVTDEGESVPTAALSVVIPSSAGIANQITLSWDPVVAEGVYYHVYRLSTDGASLVEYRLTTPNQVVNTEDPSISFVDDGTAVGTGINRGVLFTGKRLENPARLYVHVPPTAGQFNLFQDAPVDPSFTDQDSTPQNQMVISVYGIKSDGSIGGPHSITIEQYEERGTSHILGEASDMYVGVYDVVVAPGTDLNLVGGRISWSPYDLFTIQNMG